MDVPYSTEAREKADAAGAIMNDIRGGDWLGAGVETIGGGQEVVAIGFAVRSRSGKVYHLCLTELEMLRLGFRDL